ncbi:hypothetical protein HUG17_1075 [Dermatophagoides farinae]|uniref:F-box domain-containing protein n=1 Tax=Dermatophagoides farinae TaxID=6954 RepID=A0A9D4P7Y7_DERFA|nr:hypothetical protein HUG17_1075 [Dermatophagoides farinae]
MIITNEHTIDKLNDDCLQKIFDYLPISKLIELELISPRWKRIIDYRNKRQISLKLFRSRTEIAEYEQNGHIYYQLKSCPYFQQTNDFIQTTHLNYLSCQLILTKYPNLKMLLISGCQWEPKDLIMLLIELKHLECLTLIICGSPSSDDYILSVVKTIKICKSLDFLSKLKHFAISLADNTISNPFNIGFMLRVYELHLYNVNVDYNLYYYDKILDGCKNRQLQLKHLTINNGKSVSDMNVKITIKYENENLFHSQFHLLCNRFNLLNLLDIHLKFSVELKFLHLSLSKLPALKEFRLRSDENNSISNDGQFQDTDEFLRSLDSIESLCFDVDFELSIFTILPQIFPLVKHLTINISRLCCTCPVEPEHPAIPPIVEQNLPMVVPDNAQQPAHANDDRNQNQNPEPPQQQQQQQEEQQQELNRKISGDDDIEYEIDNCIQCTKQMTVIMNQWSLLEKLSIIGNRCKDEGLIELKSMPKLKSLSVANCTEIQLRSLLSVCYEIAKNRPSSVSFTLKLNEKTFKKIIKLPLKPANLFIFNVSPILEPELEYSMS